MTLKLPDYIEFTQNSKQYIADFLAENIYSKLFVLVDENTKEYCFPLVIDSVKNATIIEISSGEQNKTLTTCSYIWDAFTNANTDKNALLINLGGGVIGDMGGFCASTYKRGIDFINIPTTLLSQVDASIGGKLGIDFNGFKNHIGLFNLPKKVIIDPSFLKTLPQNQIQSGFAEMLKHGFIQSKNHLEELYALDITNCEWNKFIKKSIQIKNDIVTTDPFEKNERKFLNFGHTVGHAVESYFINNNLPILHGEAVAMGMIVEGYLATQRLSFSNNDKNKLEEIIDKYFSRLEIPNNGMEEILNNLDQDKKNKDSKIQSVLLKQIGTPVHSIEITKKEVADALNYYNAK